MFPEADSQEFDQFDDNGAEGQEAQQESQQPETEDVFMLGEEEVSPTSDDEDDPADEEVDGQPAPQWVKDLRKEAKSTKKALKQRDAELDEYKRQLEDLRQRSQEAQKPAPVITEPKLPKLEDFDYDDGKYAEAMHKYAQDFAAHTQYKREVEAKQQTEVQLLQERQQSYMQKRGEAMGKLKDFVDVEKIVVSTLPIEKQNLILKAVESNPELVVYAIGRNPGLLQEIAKEADPAMIGFRLGQISEKARIAPRVKRTVESEPQVSGGMGSSNNLDRLYKNAQQTGDYTEYFAAKRKAKT